MTRSSTEAEFVCIGDQIVDPCGMRPLYYEVLAGWRGYWDTDGAGGITFCRVARASRPYGSTRR